MGMTTYTRGEVIWLLSLSRDDAVDLDATPPDSCSHLRGSGDAAAPETDDDRLPVVARWLDVQRARGAILADKRSVASLQLYASGFSDREVANMLGQDRMAVRRKWRATVDEILEFLGGVVEPDPALSHLDLCLRCGQNVRVRLGAVKVRVRGGWRIDQPERQASVCRACLHPGLHSRIVGESTAVA